MKKWIIMGILAVLVIGMVLMSGCSSSPNYGQTGSYQIKVIYPGEWMGAMGSDGSTQSISGTGTMTYDFPNVQSRITIVAQKKDGSSQRLIIEILRNGNVIKSAYTDAGYGLVDSTLSINY